MIPTCFSPQIPSGQRLIDLEKGSVRTYHAGEDRPRAGQYAEERSLEECRRQRGRPFYGRSGTVTVD